MTDKLEFKGLDDVLAHFTVTGKDAEKAIKVYRSQVKELTGHDPASPLTPLDVVKIVQKVFFGGANASADTARGVSGSSGSGAGSVEPPHRDIPPPPGGEKAVGPKLDPAKVRLPKAGASRLGGQAKADRA